MTTTDELQKSPVIARYLAELEGGLTGVAPDERQSIVADVTDHITAEVDALPAGSDVHAVELILQRLGSPAEIAADASGPAQPVTTPGMQPVTTPETPPETSPRGFAAFRMSRGYAALTVLILAFGGILIPVLGWLTGVVFLWMSSVWRVRDKVVGTLILPGGLGFILLLTFVVPPTTTLTSCSSSSGGGQADCTTISDGPPAWFGPVLLAVLIALQIASAIYVYRSFSKRTPAA